MTVAIVSNKDVLLDKLTALLAKARCLPSGDLTARVAEIGKAVQEQGDAALFSFAKALDGVKAPLQSLLVSDDEIREAYAAVSDELIDALKQAKANIHAFHSEQIPVSWEKEENGVRMGMRYQAIPRAGLYVPGGRASYPSTVLMNAIPAQIAGVEELVMATPARADGTVDAGVLVAADLCGLSTIVKSGGAQAVFAMAYGTETVPAVDKIVGPGNIYVTEAKQQVLDKVAIDKPAGPSEVLVICNDTQYAAYAASELLAQLEHDPLASAVLLSMDESVIQSVYSCMYEQLKDLSRQEILAESIENAFFYLASDQNEVLDLANAVASEHVVLLMDDYEPFLDGVTHGGSVFCGPYTPVTLGDYYAGPNHVLPTERAARYASPLGVMDFMKYSSVLSYSKAALAAAAGHLHLLTDLEGLDAHGQAVTRRLEQE